jgi:hypothetical protein
VQGRLGRLPAQARLFYHDVRRDSDISLFTTGRRLALTAAERALLGEFFGAGLDPDVVRVRDGGVPSWLCTRSVFGTIFFQAAIDFPEKRATTWGRGLLVHETVHVWQYRTVGVRYAAGALWDQLRYAVSTGTRRGAYLYDLERGRALVAYGFEQQAQILQDHYMHTREGDGASLRRHCRNLDALGEAEAQAIAAEHRAHVAGGGRAR